MQRSYKTLDPESGPLIENTESSSTWPQVDAPTSSASSAHSPITIHNHSRIPGNGFKLSKKGRIATVAIFLLICIIAVSLGITYSKGSGNNGDGPAPLNGSPFKFSDTFDSQFKAVPVYPTWFSSQLEPDQTSTFTYTRSEDGSILQYNATSQTSSVLILSSDYPTLSFSGYELSPARNLALLVSNVTQVYRHSYKASYSLVDIKTKQVTPSFPLSRPTIQLATWAPQGELIAFVENNNVFILTEPTNPTSQTTITVTTSGTPDGTIVNGIPDWVYEEEVLASNSALWWSPSSARLCFLSFNDTNVPFYTFPHYPLTPDNPYTEPVTFRYPKPGFPNPSMTVSVFDVASQRTVALNLTSSLVSDPATQDFYITQVHWVDDTNLLSVRQYSRAQNESLLLVCNVTVALEEQDAQQALAPCYAVTRQVSTTGWLENYSSSLKFIFHETGSSFQIFDIVEVNGFAQIVTYTVPLPLSTAGADSNIATPTPITGDSWEIVSIDSIDTSNYQSQGQVIVYFTAYGKQAQAGVPSDPTQNHIYSWSNSKPAVFNCLSCEADPGCNWNSASYDIVSKYMLLTCSGPKVPYQTVRSLSKFTTDVYTIQDNAALKQAIATLGDYLPVRQYFTIPVGDSFIYASRLVPPGFDESGATKYPVLFEVYGGPFSQKVTQSFSLGWQAFLASSLGYVIISVDGRGTAGRGVNYRNAIYRNLGKYETIDQVASAKYIQTLPWADADKLAVWGWSYGGYMTSKIAVAGSGVFKVAMAVAPVIEWELYDSIYTERYMGTPQDNPTGYSESSVLTSNLNNISKLHYLVVHGTGDDNVHFQNTAVLVSALTQAYVDFQVQFYTNRDHSLTGGGTSQHLYRLLTNFLQTGLGRTTLVA